ncbi:ABC transporter permease subunit [Plantactinospora sp. KLBMP9567]|uniref:ABC transporter permease subunit n=1 Tax=Plantactinospora sp. KLBMP9567 TaxID=3085900 RepID=UPI0029811FB5|nr:ABC transporter permease subunit [Plantactinospora sp. KLBMP9567]MDW5328971.1 ABC transporter permease [Plantactinospora sp. KLBMP9567]
MNLVRAEIGRLAARRFVQLMLVLLVTAFGVTVATTLAGSHQPTAVEIRVAEARAEQQRADARLWYAECLRAERAGVPDREVRYQGDCADIHPDRIDASDFLTGVFVFDRQILDLTYFLIAFLCLFGFLVGASYIGADLTSGGMTNLLLWRPQRMVVLGTKLGTLLGGVLGLSVVASAAYLGAFRLIAEVRGLPGSPGSAFWTDLAGAVTRGLLLVLMVTALGFATATLGRHTSAALGVAAGYGVLWEVGGRIVMGIIDVARPDRLMLSSYVIAWVGGEIRLWALAGDCAPVPGSGYCDRSYSILWPAGLVVLLGLTLLALGGAFAAFRRRDLA